MKRLLTLTIWLAVAVAAIAAPYKITGPTSVDTYKIVDLAPSETGPEDLVFWDLEHEDLLDIRERGQQLSFTGPPGIYRIKCRVVPVKDGKIVGPAVAQRTVVTIGTPGPTPPGPNPPGPTPPGPTPGPAPIPAEGLRMLVVLESADATKLPSAQLYALQSKDVADYLNGKCPVGPDGKAREWRIWDKDTVATGESRLWQDALTRVKADPKFKTPWILISNGRSGFEGPLPADKDGLLNLLKQYGDVKGVGK